MDIEIFRTFLEVKDTRHFGKAAENLFLTQAAISARIKQLEEHFGVTLFFRQRYNMQLTAEGERLVPYAEALILTWTNAKQDLALKRENKNHLSIGTTAGLWNMVYQDALSNIYREFPDQTIQSVVHNSDDLLRLVVERALDIVIIFDAPNIPELTSVPAGKMKLVLATSIPNITAKKALAENYIYVDWGTAFKLFHSKRVNGSSMPILTTTMVSIAESFMKNHAASAYLPEAKIKAKKSGSIYAIDGAPNFNRDVTILYRENNDNAMQIKKLLPLLKLEK